MRPLWPQTWMSVAHTIAERSYDPRMKVGAIIVSDDNTQVLSVGYNGNYRGGPHNPESTSPGESGFIHSEINALLKCDYHNPRAKHMYVTHSPCKACAKCIINGGIKRVIYDIEYRDPTGLEILRDARIEIYSLSEAILMSGSK